MSFSSRCGRRAPHGVQQHVAAGFQVLRLRVLDFVVADAVLAGHEDHGGGRDRGHVHRVVSGAGDDVHGRQATVGGALAHLADQVGIEGRGPEILHVLQFHLDMVGRRHVLAGLAQRLVHAGERGFVLVAQVGRHAHLSGDDVARAGMGVQLAHRASAMRLVGVGDADHRLHQVAGRQQRVATDRHGRGAGVHFHAGHDDVVPAQAQRSGDHAHDLFLVLQDRALLDVRLEIGVHRTAAHRVRAGVADGLQFVAHRQALGVAGGQRGFQRELPANTPDPIITGTKREPSSLVQMATSSGASVCTPASLSVRITSRPASTP